MATTINQRIKTLSDTKYKNLRHLGKAIGYNYQEKLYRLVRVEGTAPSFEMVQDILRAFPEVNPDWLILGEGEMIRRHSKEDQQDYILSLLCKQRKECADTAKAMISTTATGFSVGVNHNEILNAKQPEL